MAKKLTYKQAEVCEYLAKGLTLRETGDVLRISLPAVKLRIKTARERIGAKNVTQLVAKYIVQKYDITEEDENERV